MGSTYEQWAQQRDRAVWSDYGIAALSGTHWLDSSPQTFPGVPGSWRAEDDIAVGEDVAGRTISLAPGEQQQVDELTLRGFTRDGVVALRVLDPEASRARGITAIDRFAYDETLRRTGRFISTADAASVPRTTVDDHATQTVFDGFVRLQIDGTTVDLSVEAEDDGTLFAVFSDATSGTETYRFRFLSLPTPDRDGTVEVDFNRAYLPPCAFSDHYVCVLPPPGNRWSVPVRAGEQFVR